MLPKNRIPAHPGQILLEEFLVPLKITQTRLAEHLGVSVQRINELVNGKRGVTSETAWLLAGAFDTTPELWMNLQTQHDLAKRRAEKSFHLVKVLKAIRIASSRLTDEATGERRPGSKARDGRRRTSMKAG